MAYAPVYGKNHEIVKPNPRIDQKTISDLSIHMSLPVLIAILGQTSSGKSDLAVQLAHTLQNAWIVNCDSRQVYRDLNIGTGKVPGLWLPAESTYYQDRWYSYQQVPHCLIDYVDPQIRYSLLDYLKAFQQLLFSRQLPKYLILTGGTGLFAKAVLERYSLEEVRPEFASEFRKYTDQLASYNLLDLQSLYLQTLESDPDLNQSTGSPLNHSDFQNPRRLQAYLCRRQIQAKAWGQTVRLPKFRHSYGFLIQTNPESLKAKISLRLQQRIQQGLLQEVYQLQHLGSRLLELGLEYRLTYLYLQGQLTESQWLDKLLRENLSYAKRQNTWFQKQPLTPIQDLADILKHLQNKTDPDLNQINF